jgi:hypothetical protein
VGSGGQDQTQDPQVQSGVSMTRDRALAHVIDLATRFGENAEEGFAQRVRATDSDSECARIADASGAELEEVTLIRDLWRAVEILSKK